METTTHTSKHFEQNALLLRKEVSRYVERGICITDNYFTPPSVLVSANLVYTLCKEIAKARNVPFVAVTWFRDGNGAAVTIPNIVKCKPLLAHAMILGHPYKRGHYGAHPVEYDKKSSETVVYYSNARGKEALKSWLIQCETDNGLRFILGLPPKVSRLSSAASTAGTQSAENLSTL